MSDDGIDQLLECLDEAPPTPAPTPKLAPALPAHLESLSKEDLLKLVMQLQESTPARSAPSSLLHAITSDQVQPKAARTVLATPSPKPLPSQIARGAPRDVFLPKATVQPAKTASSSSAPRVTLTNLSVANDAVERYSGLHIKNRLVSEAILDAQFRNRRYISLTALHTELDRNKGVVVGDWATFVVISKRNEPSVAKNGSQYTTWTVTDLNKLETKLVLFEKALAGHWKREEGELIGLLNPNVKLEKIEGKPHVTLTIEEPGKLIKIADCSDFGTCRGTRRDGMRCTLPVNVSKGQYCEFHVAAALRQIRSARLDVSNGTTEPVTRVAPPRYETKKNVFGEVVRVREKTLDELLRESDVPKLAASSSQFTKTVNAMMPRTIGTFGNRRDALDKMAEKASEEPPMPKPTTATLLQSSVPNYVSKGPVLARGNSKTEVNLHISELAAKIKAEGGSAPNISDLPAFLLRRAPSKTRPSEQPAKADVQKSSTAATAMPRKVSSVSFDDPDLPVVKRTKLEAKEESTSVLGDLNLSEEELQKLREARPAMANEIEQDKDNRIRSMFHRVQAIETLEKQMEDIRERKVTAIFCENCDKFNGLQRRPGCIAADHRFKKMPAIERFFSCDRCRAQTRTYNQPIPDSRCFSCNTASTFTRTGMLQERSGGVVGGLSLTGPASEMHPQASMSTDDVGEDQPDLPY